MRVSVLFLWLNVALLLLNVTGLLRTLRRPTDDGGSAAVRLRRDRDVAAAALAAVSARRPQASALRAAPVPPCPPAVAPMTPTPSPMLAPFLLIGIPTVPRPREDRLPMERTLLFRVLSSLQSAIAGTGAFASSVRVVVMNMRPGQHRTFGLCKEKFGQESWLQFADRPQAPPFDASDSPPPDEAEFEGLDRERPTSAARRQTVDVAALLSFAAGRSRYYYFAEDDMEFCDESLPAIIYAVDKAQRRLGNFSALRCSFGLNGIVMHNTNDMPDVAAFAAYLLRYQHRRPPDHLATEFFAQESSVARLHFGRGRRVAAFRYNVVNHLGGQQSTIRQEEAWSMPACFSELVEPQVFAVEAWSPKDCPNEDLWPCPDKERRGPRWTL